MQVSWYPYGISHAWEDDDDDDADDDDDDKDDDDDDEYSREKKIKLYMFTCSFAMLTELAKFMLRGNLCCYDYVL